MNAPRNWHRAAVVAALVLYGGFCSAWAAELLILERSQSARPEIVTVIEKLPAQTVRARFPVLLEVKWGYKSLPNGMPTEEELGRARLFYAELDRIVGESGMHAMTRTGDGGRTMYYYVENAERHTGAIRQFFDAQPPVSVKVTARAEADWSSVREVLSALKPRG